jgi:hypothetical protein
MPSPSRVRERSSTRSSTVGRGWEESEGSCCWIEVAKVSLSSWRDET